MTTSLPDKITTHFYMSSNLCCSAPFARAALGVSTLAWKDRMTALRAPNGLYRVSHQILVMGSDGGITMPSQFSKLQKMFDHFNDYSGFKLSAEQAADALMNFESSFMTRPDVIATLPDDATYVGEFKKLMAVIPAR